MGKQATGMNRWDFLIIGGGIAGVSVAAELAPHGRTLVLEQESALGYHATGRSAAIVVLDYGAPPLRALTQASLPTLLETAVDGHPLAHRKGSLMLELPGLRRRSALACCTSIRSATTPSA